MIISPLQRGATTSGGPRFFGSCSRAYKLKSFGKATRPKKTNLVAEFLDQVLINADLTISSSLFRFNSPSLVM